MSTPDILLLIIIGLSAVMGLSRGLVKEVMSLIAWVAAFFLAMYLSPRLAETYADSLGGFGMARVVLFAVVFIVTLILASMVQWGIGKLVDSTGLSSTDRILGLVFGALRGAVICIVVLIALRPFVEDTDWWASSDLIPRFMAFEEDVLSLVGYARDTVTDIHQSIEN